MTLPKFLLAWSDFNWFGFYKKLRPAKNARWSITRVFLLTLLKAGGGALVGLVLALLIFREPVGWLSWLVGLFAGCVGFCWFGVTALCWNQRAAQLRANPALNTALPKTRYGFFRALLGFVYFVVLGVFTPFALFITVENVRGELGWKRERARMEARGEKLTPREILGPQIPANQNAGDAPFFAPFFDYKIGPARLSRDQDGQSIYGSGLVWAQSNRLNQLEQEFRLPSQYLPKSSKGSRQEPKTPEIRLADWSAAYRSLVDKPGKDDASWAAELKLPPSGDPAQVVLAGISRSDKDLAAACAAAALPRAQFPIHYDEGFQALLRHLSVMKGIQQALQLRCTAHLALGETNAAFADATNALNVAELLREEPLLISQLVRYAQGAIAIRTLWQGLAEHRWTDAQLAEFQQRLGKVDYLPGIVLAFEGERTCGIEGLEGLINDLHYREMVFGQQSAPVSRLLKLISRGMLRQNQIALARCYSEMLAGLRNAITNSAETGLVTIVNSKDAKLENIVPRHYSLYSVLVTMLAPATGKATQKTVRAQTTIKMAIVACALERYHLAHGKFPENLDQLGPQFVPNVPLDPMVNQPFHYQRTDAGWFLLYSVGLNGKDDGGKMRSDNRNDRAEKDWPWPVPTRPEHPRLF